MKETHSLKIHSLKHKIECVVLGACIQEQNNFSKIQKILEQLFEKIRFMTRFLDKKWG
jgi:hypothetical protein